MHAAKKQTKDPSILGMYFYGMLTALIGAFLGGLYMASFPAMALKSQGEFDKFKEERLGISPRPGDIYLMQGVLRSTQTWEAKRQAWIDGGTEAIDFSHRELNAWLAAKFKSATTPSDEDAPKVMIIPGVPNIYIGTDIIYLSLETEFVIYGASYLRTIFVTGTIDDSSGDVEFDIETLNIENAVVPFVDILGRRIVKTLLKAYSKSDEFVLIEEAWSRIQSVEQSDGNLLFQLR